MDESFRCGKIHDIYFFRHFSRMERKRDNLKTTDKNMERDKNNEREVKKFYCNIKVKHSSNV